MKQYNTSKEIQTELKELRKNSTSIGFVPTMGALHEGHLALIRRAKAENEVVVCSIFVNPLQFNREEDLTSYPNRMKEDKKMLESVDCDYLFTPSREDLYKEEPNLNFNFGSLGIGMEAEYRPGHFEGVAAVIDRFLDILRPHRAYFGEKDFQQLAIVRWLVEQKGADTEIIECKTERFPNGLAMSSRNYNLKPDEFEQASEIYRLMQYCKTQLPQKTPQELSAYGLEKLQENFEPEYFTIVDEDTLKPIEKWSDSARPRVFVAAYLSSVRLIDNMSLID
jgi:pantoate--beta-alanine ligase